MRLSGEKSTHTDLMKQNTLNRFYTLIPISISNGLHAIWCSQPCSCVRLT